MRRREFLTSLAGLTTWPFGVHAEQAAIPSVGFLSSLSAVSLTGPVAAFRDGLQSAGYTEDKNVEIEFRWADGHYDRLPALAGDLVTRRVAVIVTVGGDPPAFAAKAASTTIPIVFMVGRDPVELGLVRSLNRPGGNATGINLLLAEMESKRIELIRQLAPTLSRHTRRRGFIILVGGAAAGWPVAAGAQQSRETRRIAVLMGTRQRASGNPISRRSSSVWNGWDGSTVAMPA